MTSISGKTAVVTGGASGLGFAIAENLIQRGAKVVIGDVEGSVLSVAVEKLCEKHPGCATGVETDVSLAESLENLRQQTEKAYGPAHLLFNNAGVSSPREVAWRLSTSAWEWVLSVNLGGVVNGVMAFMPGMIERGEGHIVNTASGAGLRPRKWMAPYAASKAAIIGVSEAIYYDLLEESSDVHISVIPLGALDSNVWDSQRNWLSRLGPRPPAEHPRVPGHYRMAPADAAEMVIAGVEKDRFWLFAGAGAEPMRDLIKVMGTEAIKGARAESGGADGQGGIPIDDNF